MIRRHLDDAPRPLRRSLLSLLPALLVALAGLPALTASADPEGDVAAARAVFEANLRAIAEKDRDAYLATYLPSPGLARTGATGFQLGYDDFAAGAGEGWPVVFDGRDLRLTPVQPGVVYGTYRYRVVYRDETTATGFREDQGLSERLFLSTDDGWRITVTTAFSAPPGTPPPPLALVGATLVDGTGAEPVPDSVVLLRDGRIECAGPRASCPPPAGVETVELSGKWLTPGIVDGHVHFSQTGWADGRPDALDVRAAHPYEQVQQRLRTTPEVFFRSYLCSGVTAVFDVGGYPWTLDLQDRAEADSMAPRVAAAGPLLSTWDFWLNLRGERQFMYLRDADTARLGTEYLKTRGASAVKVWYIPRQDRDAQEMAQAVLAAGAEAKARELPMIVHATGLREAKIAVQAGAHLLVHGVWSGEVDDAFLEAAKAAGTIYMPTMTVADGYQHLYTASLEGEPPAVDDPLGCVDAGTLERVRSSAEQESRFDAEALAARGQRVVAAAEIGALNLRRVRDAGIPIAMGTDAGNPLTLHGPSVYAEMEAMQAAGLTPMEVIVASTLGGARAMSREDELGTVAAGKLADLIVLAADPTQDVAAFRQLEQVIRGGVLRAATELRAAPAP